MSQDEENPEISSETTSTDENMTDETPDLENLDINPTEYPESSSIPDPIETLETESIDIEDDVPMHPAADAETATAVMEEKSNKAKIIVTSLVVLSVVTAFAIGVVYFVGNMSKPVPKGALSKKSSSKVSQMGIGATLIDGKAKFSKDGKTWTTLTDETNLSEGDSVQTQADSRTVLTLDDGSVVRLNASSAITLTRLATDDIVITNTAGEVYNRVVESERKYTVVVDDVQYVAQGTAYKTVNDEKEKGVQVYQSSVTSGDEETEVAEGKQLFEMHSDEKLEKKVTDISLDELKKDKFVLWNLEEDKKEKEFKDKLGYLEKVEKQIEKDKKKAEEEKKKITLSGSAYDKGVKLSWTVEDIAGGEGFKIVRSKDSSTPTFGKDEANYVDKAERSFSWKDGSGKTYYYRVCVYKAGKCTNYSNVVQVKSPTTSPTAVKAGAVILTNPSGTTVSWTYSGTAPYGFKLLMSKDDSAPTYPDHAVIYLDKGTSYDVGKKKSDGTYYVRVCKYTNSSSISGGCTDYSNTIQVVIP